jgi:hypothetical protein
LGSVPFSLAPPFEEVIFVRIELTRAQRPRSGQWQLWRLSEVLADRITSESQLFPDLAQAHACCVQFLHPLIQPPFAQELLGHSTITTTLNIYAHVLPSLHQDAMDRLSNLFALGSAEDERKDDPGPAEKDEQVE